MSPRRRIPRTPVDRRNFLRQAGCGFGAVAMAALLADGELAGSEGGATDAANATNPLAPKKPHFAAKARSVIYLYMDGGPSQVDTFDPKPRLAAESGKPFAMKIEPTQFNNNGATLGSPWKFQQYGQSGIPV